MKNASPRIFALLLCLCMLLCALPAGAVTQSEIDALELRREEIREKRDNISAQLSSYESDMEKLLAKKSALDEESALLREDILLINEQIAVCEAVVVEKEAEKETAEREAAEHYAVYCGRVRDMEEHSSWTYLSYILSSDNLSELIARLVDISDVMVVDENLRRDYLAAEERASEALKAYEDVLVARRLKLEELEAAETELNEKISESTGMIEALEADMEAYMAFQESAEAEFAQVQALIDEKAEELRKQREAEEAAQHKPISGAATTPQPAMGYYMWPSSCTRITSPFGPRVHPIYGQLKPHTGVDIGAWYGSEIYAAASGTVTSAVLDFSSVGYGSYVAIYHPNGTTTLYAHMSALAVSPGQTVSQGQVIGYVGSTGASNGPHIHFEIRQNGVCTDPVPYFNMAFSYS